MSNRTETEIKRPVEIKDNSKERVAFDLMELIGKKESGSSFEPDRNILQDQSQREYWLRLYVQCREVVGYSTPEEAIKYSQKDKDKASR